MNRTATTLIAAAVLSAGIAAVPAQASAPAPYLTGVVRTAVNTPCATEDAANCHWNARERGNGQGHSFYTIRVGRQVCTVYVDRAYNLRHGYCQRG